MGLDPESKKFANSLRDENLSNVRPSHVMMLDSTSLHIPDYVRWHLVLYPFPCKQGGPYEISISSDLLGIPIKRAIKY